MTLSSAQLRSMVRSLLTISALFARKQGNLSTLNCMNSACLLRSDCDLLISIQVRSCVLGPFS